MKKLLLALGLVLCLAVAAFAKVDVNTASVAELEAVKGLGPVKAEAIVKDREANGKFKSIQDLARVKGIGRRLVDKISDEVEVVK